MQRHVARLPRTGIRDQRIDTTEPLDCGGEQTPDFSFLGQLSLRHQRLSVAELATKQFRPRSVFSAMQHHSRAFRDEPPGNGRADGTRCARDDDGFAGEIGGHGLQIWASPEKTLANDEFRMTNVEGSSKPE
jgi:hypothetical protein